MTVFISVTDKASGSEIFINTDWIVRMQPNRKGTYVLVADGTGFPDSFDVEETAHDIIDAMECQLEKQAELLKQLEEKVE